MTLQRYLKNNELEDRCKGGEDISSISRKDDEMAGREVWHIQYIKNLQLLHNGHYIKALV